MLPGALEVVGVDRMFETEMVARSWCTRAAEVAEGSVSTYRPIRCACSTAYLWVVSEADLTAATGAVVSMIQAGSEGVSQKRGRAGLAI